MAKFGRRYPLYVKGKPIVIEVRPEKDCILDLFVNNSAPIRTFCKAGEKQPLAEVVDLKYVLIHAMEKEKGA